MINFTDSVSQKGKADGSVRLSVRLLLLNLLNGLTFQLEFFCVRVITIARLELKVTITGQGQRSVSSVVTLLRYHAHNICGNAVRRSV